MGEIRAMKPQQNPYYPGPQIPNLADLYRKHLPETGLLVEVGAYDGLSYSNTVQLLEKGWKGIYIEPVEEYAKRCRENLSGYEAELIQCACGSHPGVGAIEKRGEYSTMRQTVESDWMKPVSGRQVVEIRPLDSILEERDIESIDLLIIDCEGYEMDVMKGFSLERYLPNMIIIELHEKSSLWSELPGWREAIDYVYGRLAPLGYRTVYVDEINTIFVK